MDGLPPDRCLPFLITIDGESSNYINAALMDVSPVSASSYVKLCADIPHNMSDFGHSNMAAVFLSFLYSVALASIVGIALCCFKHNQDIYLMRLNCP